jgi:hypothetical protein
MSTIYDINLFEQFRNTYPNADIHYIPNIAIKKKSGPKQRDVNRDTHIYGNCVSDNCENRFDKSFRELVDINKGPYCGICTKERSNCKRKETKSSDEYKPKLEETNKKRKETKSSDEYKPKLEEANKKRQETFRSKYDGATNPSQIQEVQDNKKQTLIDKGVLVYSLEYLEECLKYTGATLDDKIHALELVRESPIRFICNCGVYANKSFTTIKKYGAFCDSCQDIHAKKKSIETHMRVRGVIHSSNDPLVISKIKETNFKNWGTETPQQLEEVKQKSRDTCQLHFGVDAPQQSKIVQETTRLNNQKKYNVDHPMHVPELAEKCSKSSYVFYDYVFPSGRIDRIQGTEKYTIDHLLSIGIHEDDIITKRTEVPEVWWVDAEEKKHRYYVDTYVKSQELCIESKSTYTAEKKKDTIFLKQNAVKKAGYKCEIWVYDSKGKQVERLV